MTAPLHAGRLFGLEPDGTVFVEVGLPLDGPTCSTCGKVEEYPGQLCELSDGSRMCGACWNQSVRDRRAARQADLDAEPRCEACGKHRANWTVAGVGLCGRCKSRAERTHRADAAKIPAHLAGLAVFGPGPSWDRETVLEYARGETR